jgi:phosphoglycolate phosphatase-like HAD superfamily hydrolase
MHLVVFDIDGTLTDTNQVDGDCYWRAVCEVFGLAAVQPDWSDFRHVTDVGIARELCERHLGRVAGSSDIDALRRRFVAILELALAAGEPVSYQIPGAAAILFLLRTSRDFAVALATGGFQASARLKLSRAGLFDDAIPLATYDDAISREQIMRIAADRAAEQHASGFARITFVGDGLWDLEAARNLGWDFVGIASADRADRLRRAGAAPWFPTICRWRDSSNS